MPATDQTLSFLEDTIFLVTAGPTHEPIDPVRFIGNHSSGKMGFALAESLANNGAQVYLISGPVHLSIDHPLIERIDVTTAEEMYNVCIDRFNVCDGAILAAAVADFRPARKSELKIKKSELKGEEITLRLIKNKDILASLGAVKKPGQVLVGFSLETHDEMTFAKEKLHRKNCDMVVLNSLKDEGAGFAVDTNKVTIITADGGQVAYPLKSKKESAADIVNFIQRKYFPRNVVND